MEEKKDMATKVASQVKSNDKPQKMSYEQLEQTAHQLSEQARQLYNQLQKSNLNNMFKRLDYLFKVIENGSVFSKTFFETCIKEIETIMTVPEEAENNEGIAPNTESKD